jgi:hypothetical protein
MWAATRAVVQPQNTNTAAVTLGWNYPSNYTLRYGYTTNGMTNMVTVPAPEVQFRVSGLKKGSNYFFTVAANIFGGVTTLPTDPLSFTVTNVPPMATNVVSLALVIESRPDLSTGAWAPMLTFPAAGITNPVAPQSFYRGRMTVSDSNFTGRVTALPGGTMVYTNQ